MSAGFGAALGVGGFCGVGNVLMKSTQLVPFLLQYNSILARPKS